MVQTATLDLEGPLAVIRFLLMFSLGSRASFVTVRAPSVGTSGLQRFVRDCSGAVAVEFLVILGPLLLLLLGTFDIGIVTLTATRINLRWKLRRSAAPSGPRWGLRPPRRPPTALPSRGCRASMRRVSWSLQHRVELMRRLP